MKILVTGGSSFLGQHLVPMAIEQGHDVVYTTYSSDPLRLTCRRPLDVRDGDAAVRLAKAFRPDVIIHLAGSNRNDDMVNVIVEGTESMVNAAESVGSKLIFMSSDVIFDGKDAPYDEAAVPNPLHEYGRAKVVAEQLVGCYANHVIIRTSLIYSTRIMDRGTEWVRDEIEAGRPVTLFTNQIRQPIHADDLSRACLDLATLPFLGIINVVGSEPLSRAEFGKRMMGFWQIPVNNHVHFAPDNSGRWPVDTRLDISVVQNMLSFPLQSVTKLMETLP